MAYKKLLVSANLKEIGKFPQTDGLPEGYTVKWFDNENSMTKLTEDKLPENQPDLLWQLKKNAKLTDVISPSNISVNGFLMSEKAAQIFSQFNLGVHKFHEAKLIYNHLQLRYWFLQLVHEKFNFLDFRNSKFIVTDFVNQKVRDIVINSEEELFFEKEKLPFGDMIKAEHIFYKTEGAKKDLIYFPIIHLDVFASTNLLDRISKEKLTGIEVKEQNILFDDLNKGLFNTF